MERVSKAEGTLASSPLNTSSLLTPKERATVSFTLPSRALMRPLADSWQLDMGEAPLVLSEWCELLNYRILLFHRH